MSNSDCLKVIHENGRVIALEDELNEMTVSYLNDALLINPVSDPLCGGVDEEYERLTNVVRLPRAVIFGESPAPKVKCRPKRNIPLDIVNTFARLMDGGMDGVEFNELSLLLGSTRREDILRAVSMMDSPADQASFLVGLKALEPEKYEWVAAHLKDGAAISIMERVVLNDNGTIDETPLESIDRESAWAIMNGLVDAKRYLILMSGGTVQFITSPENPEKDIFRHYSAYSGGSHVESYLYQVIGAPLNGIVIHLERGEETEPFAGQESAGWEPQSPAPASAGAEPPTDKTETEDEFITFGPVHLNQEFIDAVEGGEYGTVEAEDDFHNETDFTPDFLYEDEGPAGEFSGFIMPPIDVDALINSALMQIWPLSLDPGAIENMPYLNKKVSYEF